VQLVVKISTKLSNTRQSRLGDNRLLKTTKPLLVDVGVIVTVTCSSCY